MTTLEETKKNCEKPCLCDTCLKARDAELLRLRKTLLEECVEMGERLKKPVLLPSSYKELLKQDEPNRAFNFALDDYQSKLREKINNL